ncbi:TetR/AcrR family transcriptional regulator [Croceicoccus sp. YJ47]|uniref:TetR/AcrR family transcriptional regulator n=1 Tax=Croceicoccus sp. YJ47 TaxID=2798724 RepID=UPI0019209AAF|nr:TetR/AcrR family transcriptional regulator [Croceicoccus sp. YJ47]QQN75323.1 TetR/AcrR family transcriptional regulator [Croceicoccus sp. YJ47]
MTTLPHSTAAAETHDDLAETEAVLNAAVAEFLAKGYEGANLRAIVNASGRSIGGVYRRFGNKHNLFREAIARHADLSLPRNARLRTTERPVADDLCEFAIAYLKEFFDPTRLNIFRMVIAEAAIIPDLVTRLWEIGPLKAIEQVAGYLRTRQSEGLIDVDDADLAAAQFIDMIKAGMHVRQLMARISPTTEEIERSACTAAAIFAKGISADQP